MSHRREEEEEERAELQEQALTQIQHIAHDGVLAFEAGVTLKTIEDHARAMNAKLDRIANIAEVGEPDEDWREDFSAALVECERVE